MTKERNSTELQKKSQAVDGELYEELLNRYERVLVFAAKLQEKLNQQKLLAEKTESLEQEKQRLNRLLAVEQSYVRILENALRSLGLLSNEPDD